MVARIKLVAHSPQTVRSATGSHTFSPKTFANCFSGDSATGMDSRAWDEEAINCAQLQESAWGCRSASESRGAESGGGRT